MSLSAEDNGPTLIFDEIDAGIGGLTLTSVGAHIRRLANTTQILLITHWPQLASLADRHFEVVKSVENGQTITRCHRLTGEAVAAELSRMYPSFAAVAKEEGYEAVAVTFLSIAKAEGFHKKRYQTLAANIQDGKVFKRGVKVVWRCRNCGFPIEGEHAPEKCPACEHPQAYFEIVPENW